jgi:uncharacterized protein YdhG (YjbR/CyaY superfamily)
MPAKPKTFDDCLAAVSADKRAVLEKLRKVVHAAAPGVEEYVGYGLAAFRIGGKPLVAIGASANHFALYMMNGSTIEAHKDELKDRDTSKGGIRFPADEPLPVALVRKLVKIRVAENVAIPEKPGKRAAKPSRTDAAVITLLADLEHPLKKDIEVVRKVVLGVSPEIREAVKWNAPSFRTTDFFATVNLRAKDAVQLVFHTGAKVKEYAKSGIEVADPAGLLKWLAKDRAAVTLGKGKEIQARRAAFEQLVRDWIRLL